MASHWYRRLLVVLAIGSAAPCAIANDLDCFCRDWKTACGGDCDETLCPATPSGDYGLEFDIFQGAAGCTIPAAEVKIANNNSGISVMVFRYGSTPANNIYFQNACPFSTCTLGDCCPGCECHSATCPPGGCEILPGCEVCGCEIEAKTVTLLAGDGPSVQVCLTPDSLDNPCDSTECDDSSFCLFLTPHRSRGGIHFKISRVSFDGGVCWSIPGTNGIPIDEEDVVVTTMPGCPATQGANSRRICE